MVGRGHNHLIEEEDEIVNEGMPPSHVLSYVFKRDIIYCFTIMHAILLKLLACHPTHQPDPLAALYLIP